MKASILLRYGEMMTGVSENHTNIIVHDHRQSLTEVGELTL